jgi:hypothetical protein
MASLDVGTLTIFPGLRPDGPHQREWAFKNDTDKDWTDIWISTHPQAWHGAFTDPFGGRGNPPNIVSMKMTWDNKIFRATNQGEDFHNELDPAVRQGHVLSIQIDFDDGFEEFEYLQFSFSWSEYDDSGRIRRSGIPVEGSRTIGRDLPSSDTGPLGDAIGSGIGVGLGLIGRAETPRPPTGEVLALAAMGRELQLVKRRLFLLQNAFDRHIASHKEPASPKEPDV